MLSQGGDLNFLDPDDIELGVPRQDTVCGWWWLHPYPPSQGIITVHLRLQDAETDDEARADAELTGVAQHKPSRPMMQSSKPVKPSKSKAKKKKLSGHAD